MPAGTDFFYIKHDRLLLAGLEKEVIDAGKGGRASADELERVRKLDGLLKIIKAESTERQKSRFEGVPGILSFCDELDALVGDQGHSVSSMPDVAEWLESKINTCNLNSKDCVLSRAISWGLLETVVLLLDCGADPDNSIDFCETFKNAKDVVPNFKETWELLMYYVQFPYMVLTTIEQYEKRREQQENKREEFAEIDHLARTLDESYYPGLPREVLEVRNHDQIVSHSKDTFKNYDNREKKVEDVDRTAFILMVPQLWLLRFDNVVVSAYTMPEGTEYSPDDFINGMYDYVRREYQIEGDEPAVYLSLIIAGFIDRFGEGYTHEGVDYPPPLDLFETRVVNLLLEVRSYIEKAPGGKSSFSSQEYRRERYFIHVISDLRSELAMIQYTLEQQERVLKQFPKDDGKDSAEERSWERERSSIKRASIVIESSQAKIRQYMERVEKIDRDAERIEKSIQDMLNLKRTHASIRDAHSSLIVSTAVIGFAVITVVFTPLAFLTALFALKIDGFEYLQVSGSDGVYHSGKIGGVFDATM
ncbi:hypothetical protein E8E13_002262 [Curvularia kusanoi]|uniref:Ankyrin repeat protein n=1 Tax=Curvularia kusanoi TaxID=90978 RepID=A0A9P4TFV1_CURKU|nr:hypothetical protein E8E13_002262 [Curvularia kusanoi]